MCLQEIHIADDGKSNMIGDTVTMLLSLRMCVSGEPEFNRSAKRVPYQCYNVVCAVLTEAMLAQRHVHLQQQQQQPQAQGAAKQTETKTDAKTTKNKRKKQQTEDDEL